jgi:hypothetical protein
MLISYLQVYNKTQSSKLQVYEKRVFLRHYFRFKKNSFFVLNIFDTKKEFF